MTSEEYEQQKAEIIKAHGQPERDYDQTPLNESARLINALRTKKRVQAARDKKLASNEAGQDQAPDNLTDFVKAIPNESLRRAMNKALPPIFLEEHDIKAFSDSEKAIIIAHFENRSLNQEQLALRFNTKRQTITRLFNSREFKLIKLKYFELEAPEATRIALLHLLHDNDQKTAHRLAEHYGIIKAEKMDMNITNKPIEDPEAMRMLKELGDKLSEKKDK